MSASAPRGTTSTSERVSTPIGMAAVEHEHRRALLEARHHARHRLADPDHRHRRAHDLGDRAVEHAVVAEREVHQLELAQRADDLLRRERELLRDAHDQLRHAGLVHQRDRVAHRLVGRDEHEVGQPVALGREHVARDRALGAQEAHVEHPLVVEDLREVAAARSRGAARPRPRRGRASRATSSAACTAVPPEPPMSSPSSRVTRRAMRNDVGVAHLDDAVDDAAVEGRRPEVLADAFGEIRAAGAAGVHRARRVGADDLHGRVLRLQRAPDTGDRAAGADARDEVRDAAARLLARSRARSSARARAGSPGSSTDRDGTRPASRARGARRSSSTSAGLRAAPPWGTRRPRRRTHAATRPSRRSSCRSSRRCSGSRAARRRSRGRRRCCPTSARRSCRPACSRPSRSAASIIAIATRSFTLPPGFAGLDLGEQRALQAFGLAQPAQPHERRVADEVEDRVGEVHRLGIRELARCHASTVPRSTAGFGVRGTAPRRGRRRRPARPSVRRRAPTRAATAATSCPCNAAAACTHAPAATCSPASGTTTGRPERSATTRWNAGERAPPPTRQDAPPASHTGRGQRVEAVEQPAHHALERGAREVGRAWWRCARR